MAAQTPWPWNTGAPKCMTNPHNSQVGWEDGGNQNWSGFEMCPRSEPGGDFLPRLRQDVMSRPIWAPPGLGCYHHHPVLPQLAHQDPKPLQAPALSDPHSHSWHFSRPHAFLVEATPASPWQRPRAGRGLPQNNASLSTACSLQKDSLTQAEPTCHHHYSSPAWPGATSPSAHKPLHPPSPGHLQTPEGSLGSKAQKTKQS